MAEKVEKAAVKITDRDLNVYLEQCKPIKLKEIRNRLNEMLDSLQASASLKLVEAYNARKAAFEAEFNQEMAVETGFEISQIESLISGKKTRKAMGPVAVKYRDPENAANTWTGRGRAPLWIKAAKEKGRKLEDMKIAAVA